MPESQYDKYRKDRPFNQKLADETVDYTDACEDFAVYLPATSANFIQLGNRERLNVHGMKMKGFEFGERVPKKFDPEGDELNYYQRDSGSFYYPYGLYSAGHATLDLEKSYKTEVTVQGRDPAVTLVGDSGGFQWATGTWTTKWPDPATTVDNPDWDDIEAINSVRKKVLRWLENTFDYCMTLDMPTAVMVMSKDPKAKEIFTSAQMCLDFTKKNLDYFVKHRTPGKTNFLNVLQGANEEEQDHWYEEVKDYDFEGWAIAGDQVGRLVPLLRRIIKLRDDGKINDHQHWIHCLGVSRLSGALIFTAIQRELRKTCGPKITVSFDSSSPFLASSKGMCYTGNFFDTSAKRGRPGFTFRNNKCADDKKYIGDHRTLSQWISEEYHIDEEKVSTGVGRKLLMSDICFKDTGNSTWDSASFIALMGHNAEMLIKAVHQACRYADLEDRHEAEKYVPRDLLELILDIIPEIFAADDPNAKIKYYESKLRKFDFNQGFKDTSGNQGAKEIIGTDAYADPRSDELRNYKAEKLGFEDAGQHFEGLNTSKRKGAPKIKTPNNKVSTLDSMFDY